MAIFRPTFTLPSGITRIRAGAELGIAYAQWMLGMAYDSGIDAELDLDQARLWFNRSADGGCTIAMRSLAALYERGAYGDAARPLAFGYWKRGADLADQRSQLRVGMIYLYGEGQPQDLGLASKYLALASYNGSPVATYHLAYLKAVGNPAPSNAGYAMDLLKSRSDAADHDMTYALAWHCLAGIGRDAPSKEQGMQKLSMAADAQHPAAMRDLGKAHLDGNVENANPLTGTSLLHAAALAGDSWAQALLGYVSAQGIGTYPDLVRARQWIEQSVATGFPAASCYLGQLESIEPHSNERLERVLSHYEDAIAKGCVDGRNARSGLAIESLGHFSTAERLIPWIESAVGIDGARSFRALGDYYQEQLTAAPENHDLLVRYEFWRQVGCAEDDHYCFAALGEHLSQRGKHGQNMADAIALLSSAAATGCYRSAAKLAYHFNFSTSLIRNPTYAADINEYAAEGGDDMAAENLSIQLRLGQGIGINTRIADYWTNKSIDIEATRCLRQGLSTLPPSEPAWERKKVATVLEFKKRREG